ncbi:MAG: hypothetical protein ACI9SB_000994 [Candidatus Azotimanducaceae bacterium]|jgi:hypothetical protein
MSQLKRGQRCFLPRLMRIALFIKFSHAPYEAVALYSLSNGWVADRGPHMVAPYSCCACIDDDSRV